MAVAGALSGVAPTHLHVASFADVRAPLEQVGNAVNVGGTAYRIMRTTSGNLRGQLDASEENSSPLEFSLQYATGYLTETGTIDTGVDHAIGEYVSLGSGEWLGPIAVRRPTNELQTAVDGANGAGVASITYPTNVTDWDRLDISVWFSQGSDVIPISIPTAVLAVQSTGKEFLVSRAATGGGNGRLTLDTAARTLTVAGTTGNNANTNNPRIIYAALKD